MARIRFHEPGVPGVPGVPVLLSLLFAVSLAAQQPPSPRTGALAPGGTGVVAGRVVDPVSGAGVSDAIVWLLVDGILRNESPRIMSDSVGRFAFVNVPAGRYSFQAQKLGYLRGLLGQKHTVDDQGTELDVTDGQILTDISIPIWKHAAIGGTITDEAGEPVVGVSVRAFRRIVAHGETRFTSGYQGTVGLTDDRGVFRLSALLPGEYIVVVPSQLTTFPADIMRDVFRPDITSEASGAISELSPLGYPANQQIGASVIMGGNRAIYPPAAIDDVAAVYRTTLFPAATKLGDATTIVLRPGEERSGVDIALRPVQAGRVIGRIIAPDGVAGPTAIRLLPAGDALLSPSREFDVATGLSDAAGQFTLLGVPEGQYLAVVEKRPPAAPGQPADTRGSLFGSEFVAVGSASVSEVSITLRSAPRMTVRFDMRDGRTLQSGDAELFIEAVGPGGRANLFPDSSKPAVAPLPPGRYVVTASVRKSTCTAALFQGRDVSDEPIVLGTEDVDVTVVCGEQPTRLTGTVRTERGSPDAEALVVAFPADRRFWSGAGLRVRRKASAFTSAAGSFTIVNLPPGDYLVAALPIDGSDFWQDPKVLDALSATAARVSFAAGETRSVDVRTGRIR